MTTTCKLCGEALDIPDVEGACSEMCNRLLVGAVHDACADRQVASMAAIQRAVEENCNNAEARRVVPPLFWDTDARRLSQPWHVQALSWVYGDTGLLLYGKTGSGKSRCAYKLVEREILQGHSVEAYSHGEFCRDAVRGATDRVFADGFNRRVRNCDILLVDDIGKARLTTLDGGTKVSAEALFDTIDHRSQHRLPCIFTTNCTGADFERQWGDHGAALSRRLREFCKTVYFK